MNNAELHEAAGAAISVERMLDVSALLGEWSNTNPSATGIVRLLLTRAGESSLRIKAWSARFQQNLKKRSHRLETQSAYQPQLG